MEANEKTPGSLLTDPSGWKVYPPEELLDMEAQETMEPQGARQKAYRKWMEDRIAAYLEAKNATIRKWMDLNLQAIELEKVRLQSQVSPSQPTLEPFDQTPLGEILKRLADEDVCPHCGKSREE